MLTTLDMLKLCGVLLILLVGGCCAYLSVCYEKKRVRVVEGWIDLIHYIRTQIDCYLMPMQEILANGDRMLLEACMSPANAADLPEILNASSIYLDGGVRRLLERFIYKLGDGYREEQLLRCDECIRELQAHKERLSAELAMRIRIVISLCLCIAAATAILLW